MSAFQAFFTTYPGTEVFVGASVGVVVADGTAKRTEKAPGHFDPRAESFDDSVDAALRNGDPDGLLALDEAAQRRLWELSESATGIHYP